MAERLKIPIDFTDAVSGFLKVKPAKKKKRSQKSRVKRKKPAVKAGRSES
jgi:hypothetical protein